MKHALRSHDFGYKNQAEMSVTARSTCTSGQPKSRLPRRVAAKIVTGFVARRANIDILAAPRFAPSPILARTARAFHSVRGSTAPEPRT